MSNLGLLNGPALFVSILCGLSVPMLIVLCFNYTLTFFEFLHKGDERSASKNKIAATICLFLFFSIPVVYSIYILFKFKG
ncbi:hypothetical protein NDK43_06660 [Neobacillus pocheonensis]|uniref:Cardiolipin synthase N-terminal domain-containing protein n=1 Tax=Neobacillus pocheonensis TaxID=363869 RepID=A0ABT0W736_9BACI|nr:hypothetical protein [Neobacillus pocheonensis]